VIKMILKVTDNYYISKSKDELERILRRVTGNVFSGRIEKHGDFFGLRIWQITNQWITDDQLRQEKEEVEGFLEGIQGQQPLEIKAGIIDDLPDLGEPEIVVERDPDGEYSIEIYKDQGSIFVLYFRCDITVGYGDWSLHKYKL